MSELEKIRFYLDEHIPQKVQKGLAEHGYEAIMARDVDMLGKDDDTEHLPYAQANKCVLVTFDLPFAGRSQKRSDHAGLICWTGAQDDYGGLIRQLVVFAENQTQESAMGLVFWLR